MGALLSKKSSWRLCRQCKIKNVRIFERVCVLCAAAAKQLEPPAKEGLQPLFGEYLCRTCEFLWTSRLCWPCHYQTCKKCQQLVYPHNWLNYAVITFICENNEEYISAAPKKWIDDDQKSCKWPKSKTLEKKAINLQMTPENDWKEYTIVKVFGYYATLKEAVAVEKAKQFSSSSESEEPTLKRKITLNRRYRDDSLSPPPTPQGIHKGTVKKAAAVGNEKQMSSDSESKRDTGDTATVKKAVAVCNEKQISSDSDSADHNTDTDDSLNNQDFDRTLTAEDIRLADVVFQDDMLLKGNTDHQSISGTSNTASDYGDIMSELKEIRSLVTYTIHRVGKIEQLLQIGRQSDIKKNLLPTLPLTELSQLKTFEEKLADENIKQQLFDLLRFTGGSKERDCVNRNLEKIFSNYLAQFCSWTGKKNNFKLSTLKLMATLKLAAKESFPNMTDDSFERHVMSWFQHATTRLKRQNID